MNKLIVPAVIVASGLVVAAALSQQRQQTQPGNGGASYNSPTWGFGWRMVGYESTPRLSCSIHNCAWSNH
jgi:hypothetical protein